MVIRRQTYPQVDPRAEGLMSRALAVVPGTLTLGEAMRVARRRRARLLAVRRGGGWSAVTRATLEHALRLGLHDATASAALWAAPVLRAEAPEVAVRRRLAADTPFLLVADTSGRPVGVVLRESDRRPELPASLAAKLRQLPEDILGVLRAAGAAGADLGWPVAAVGGLTRDLALGEAAGPRMDLDLAVEGDGRALARRLAAVLSGRVIEHDAFLTATVTLPGGRRLDVATARRERYPAPGALPRVEAAGLAEDLMRRDFSINALAIRLDGPRWGELADPTGGFADLRRGRIRVLHPLSFVEDPTRIFRAMRFAVRLHFRLEPSTARLLTSAARLSVYPALSGERLSAELDLVLAEPEPVEVLTRLGRAGAFRLVTPDYRFTRTALERLAGVAACLAGTPVGDATARALYVLALTAHLRPDAGDGWGARLRLAPAVREAVGRARTEAPSLVIALDRAPGPAAAYAVLRHVPEVVAAWARVIARRGRARRHLGAHLARWRSIQPLVSGEDLRAMGLEPGPAFGQLLDGLCTAQVAGRVVDRAAAIGWIEQALVERGERGIRAYTPGSGRGSKGA